MQVGSGPKSPVDAAAASVAAAQHTDEAGPVGDQILQAQGRLAQIDAEYPDLDNKLAHEKQVFDDIKDSDTWGGFKMYEKVITFLTFGLGGIMIIGANKDMIRGQKSLVSDLEAAATERAHLQSMISQGGTDQFERA